MSRRARTRGPQWSERSRWSSLAVAIAIWTSPNPSLSDAGFFSLPDSVAPCVLCHSQAGNDQVGEWLASPYSETEGGRGCTGCHGRPCTGMRSDREIDAGEPTIDSRRLKRAARLTLRAVCSGGAVEAEVAVSNLGVGHLLPTGPEARTLFLEVSARDEDRPPLPPRAGSGNTPAPGRGATGPGRALILNRSLECGTVLRRRLPPFATDLRRFRFESPDAGTARVSARLVLSRIDEPPVEIASTSTVCSTPEDEPRDEIGKKNGVESSSRATGHALRQGSEP